MRTVSLILLAVLLNGCGAEFNVAPVSGIVTLDGDPVEGAEVVFAPMESSETVNPGPVSIGTTDATGAYALTLVNGSSGAIVTRHRVGISYGEIDESTIAAKIDEAYAKNPNMSERQFMALEKKMISDLNNGMTIPTTYNEDSTLQIDVPAGGTDAANFDLKSDGT